MRLRTRPSLLVRFVLLAAAGVLGCSEQADPSLPGPEATTPMLSVLDSYEAGEIYGRTFVGSVRTRNLGYDIRLTPEAALTPYLHPANRGTTSQVSGVLSLLEPPTLNKVNDFDWWDPKSGSYPCAPDSGPYSATNGPGDAEVHFSAPVETHCVASGRYTMQVETASLLVDYFPRVSGPSFTITNSLGAVVAGKPMHEVVGSQGPYYDFILHVDAGGNQQLAEQRSLIIDAVNPGAVVTTPMVEASSVSGNWQQVFRFAPAFSGSAWNGGGEDEVVVRLLYDLRDLSQRTGFFTPHYAQGAMVRTRTYPKPPLPYASCKIRVGLEILRPDEVLDANILQTPDTTQVLTKEITITGGDGATVGGLCPTPEVPPVYHGLTLTASGSGGGVVATLPGVSPPIECAMTGSFESGACTASYLQGSTVTLTAARDSTSLFTGWGTPCSGTGVCSVTMSQARNVSASFQQIVLTRIACQGTNGGTSYKYQVSWTPVGTAWEVRHSNVDNVATAPLMASGTLGNKVWSPYYNVSTQGPARYWWVRVKDAAGIWSSWILGAGSPQLLSDGCLF